MEKSTFNFKPSTYLQNWVQRWDGTIVIALLIFQWVVILKWGLFKALSAAPTSVIEYQGNATLYVVNHINIIMVPVITAMKALI